MVRLIEEKLVPSGFVAITNNEESTPGRHADIVLPLYAGQEATIFTKTYTNTLGVFYLMAAAVQNEKQLEQAFSDLEHAASCLFSADKKQIEKAAAILHSGNSLAFV